MMKAYLFTVGLAMFGTVFGVALHPVRQLTSDGGNTTEANPTATITVTTTITDTPATITIAVENSTSVEQSLSSAASIDTLQVSQESELAPVSNMPFQTTPVFVHSIVASVFLATEVSGTNSSVYYVSVGPNTTDWNYTPSNSITVGLTTVTVQPVESTSTTDTTTTIFSTASVTATSRSSFSSPALGWNTTYINASSIAPVTGYASGTSAGYGYGYGYVSGSGTNYGYDTCSESASAELNTTATIVTDFQPYETSAAVEPGLGDTDFGFDIQAPDEPPTTPFPALAARQTCTVISAEINYNWVTWCNNWDGSTTLPYTIWDTTVTPGSPDQSTAQPSASSATTTSTITINSASSTPTLCGEAGPFEIGFDELPQFFPTNNDTADFPPIFNPFEHFWWGDGWAYVPPPTEPFPPQNGTHLAEFVPSLANTDIGSPNAGLIPNSSFGAGPRDYDQNYWFSADSAWVGCDNGATDPSITCDFVATGYQWDPDTQQEQVVTTQHFPQPPCPRFQNCKLRQIFFSSEFTALTTLSFYANVQGSIKIFWIDSIDLDWYNNTCAAGLARASSRKA